MRVQAIGDVAKLVQRDGEAVALRHGQKEPEDGVSGARILSQVRVPADSVIVTGDAIGLQDMLVVSMLHVRNAGWPIVKHRVQLGDLDGKVVKASPWEDGPWPGDSVLSVDFDPGLPPEANPA